MARKRKGKSRLKMSTGQAKLLDSASGQVSFRYNMKYIYHCEYLVKEPDAHRRRCNRTDKRGLKAILYWKGTRRFPFQTNPFLVFHPAAELRGILLIKI